MAFGIFYSETTKVVKVKNVPLAVLRLFTKIALFGFVVIYEIWYAKGYQKSTEIQSSLTVKVKGSST